MENLLQPKNVSLPSRIDSAIGVIITKQASIYS